MIASVSLSYMIYMQLSMSMGREVCYQCLWGGRFAINVYGEGGLLSMSMGREVCYQCTWEGRNVYREGGLQFH